VPLEGLTVIHGAEVVIVQLPVAVTVMNWLPASPETLWVLMLTTGGTRGSSLMSEPPPHETTISDSAKSAATDDHEYDL
jgi:hypothetical protein